MVDPIPVGSPLLAEDLAEWEDAIDDLETEADLLGDPPGGQFRQSVAQTLTSGSFTAITFTQEDYDNRGGHSTSSNTSRYTAQVAGRYQVSGAVAFVASATGRRGTQWRINGSVVNGSQLLLSSGDDADETQYPARTMTVFLSVGQYVELYAIQQSGGNLNTSVADGGTQSMMAVRYVGST